MKARLCGGEVRKPGLYRCIDPVAIILAAAAAIASFLICKHVLGFISHVPDETSYLFQGRILASGRLWLAPPPVSEAFSVDQIMISGGRWCSFYPPGWPFLLSIGWLLGSTWALNPVLTGISALGVWRLGTLLYGRDTGRLACALFCVSPFVLLTGSGSMSHMATLCASIWSVAELIAAFESQKKKHYILAGLLVGFAAITRPFTAFFLLLPAFLWTLIHERHRLLFTLIGFIPCAVVGAVYNWTLFGNVIEGGYPYNPLYRPVEFSARYYLQNIPWYFFRLNDSLWQWPWPDLIIFLPLLFYKSKTKTEWLPLLCSLSLIGAYGAFSYRDIVYSGPRYIFEIVGFLSVFAAHSIRIVIERIQNKTLRALLVLPILILPLVQALPAQIHHHSMIYHGQSVQFIRIMEQSPIGKNALILLSGDPYILRTFFFLNALEPATGDRVFMRDIVEKRAEILAAYPRKEVWKLTIQLEPIPGINPYPDRWRIRQAKVTPLRHPNLKKPDNSILHTNQRR